MEKASINKKISAVNNLSEKIKEAKTILMFDYQGLTVEQFTQLRGNLRAEGCEVAVFKNNIARRASIAAGFESLADSFVGAKALVLSYNDVVAPAKIVADFAKGNDIVKIGDGVIEGKVVDKTAILALANLPSRETLLTQLAAGLLMPIRELAIGLNMISEEQN